MMEIPYQKKNADFREKDLLEFMLEAVLETLEAELGSIMLLDQHSGDLLIHVARGLSKEIIATTRQKLGKGASGWVASTGEWLTIDSESPSRSMDNDLPLTRSDLSSAVIIPLKFFPLKIKYVRHCHVSGNPARIFPSSKGPRQIKIAFSHPIFTSSSADPQS